ncbi:CidB/LrgB family autolysis modulator [Pullulanibacillus sp. KACC 23026]|uniref:CidB/LrgB family autolysis modulator n=1 Tax=Pullulanibacillus sp. KACC 23026 TaxID=3028315 RepID=UPI0023AF3526|nr:CidB/LrgB family autolysis modulator [Pullulanibacillus sp. KACC 23026]WEG14757.1 CidB/LrgB family autolysis modulator [Pullulanibacillus sp. KACC 23026]
MILGILSLLGTIGIYYGAKKLYQHKAKIYLTPLLITPIILIALILFTHLPFQEYNAGGKWLTYLLQPATIAFAVPLYKNFDILKKHIIEILIGVAFGSGVAMVSSLMFSKWLHLSSAVSDSVIPRSVTTPIAMNISEYIGGVPTITAVVVIMTGILGSIIGPYIIRWLRIDNEIARGVLFGTAAHGAGTSKAFELSPVTGTISSISMILAALFTLCVAPLVF